MPKRFLFILMFSALLLPVAAQAEYTIWHSPLNFTTHDPSIIIEPYFGPPTAVKITATTPGDLQWPHLGLTLPSNVLVTGVTFCYEMPEGQESYISQIRLSRMNEPDAATVLWDDGTDLIDPGPVCVTSIESPIGVEGTITLALRLNVAASGDYFIIGGIGIIVEEINTAAPNDFGVASPRLQQSVPNPFSQKTRISFELPTACRRAELQIVDVSGRSVRNVLLSSLPAGRHDIVWDGKNDSGSRLAAGTYYSRLVADGRVIGTGDMILLK